ncbi:hypothetical protein J2W96_006899 [Variovorax guangxiensis]|nr:hypothetical protein [Variovorax guangxiensis]
MIEIGRNLNPVLETAIRSQNEDEVRLLAQRVNTLLVQAT